MGSVSRGKIVNVLLKKLSGMQESGTMCDLLIHLQDGSDFNAHRLLFCALSDLVMETCASLPPDHITDPKSSWILDFSGTGISVETMSVIVDFVYGRDINLDFNSIKPVKQAAELLGMPAVISLCEKRERLGIPTKNKLDDDDDDNDAQMEDDDPEFKEPAASIDKREVTPGGRPKRKRKLPSKFSGNDTYIVGEDLKRHFRAKKKPGDNNNLTTDTPQENENKPNGTNESLERKSPDNKSDSERLINDSQCSIKETQSENIVGDKTEEDLVQQNDRIENDKEPYDNTSPNMTEDPNVRNETVAVLVEDINGLQAENGGNIFETEQGDGSVMDKTGIINVSAYSQEAKFTKGGEQEIEGEGQKEKMIPAKDSGKEEGHKNKENENKVGNAGEGESGIENDKSKSENADPQNATAEAGKQGQYYTCEVCDSRFKQRRYLKEHFKNSHSNKETFYCEDCNSFFKRLDQYRQHMALHLGTYKCQKCGKVFSRKRRLEDHIPKCKGVKILSTKRPQLYCDKCEKLFLSFVSLNNHIEREHLRAAPSEQPQGENQSDAPNVDTGDGDKTDATQVSNKTAESTPAPCAPKNVQKCSICSLIFGNVAGLTAHMRSEHFGIRYECEKCGLYFDTSNSLKYHKQDGGCKFERATADSDPFLTCQMCQVVFPDRGNLQRHMRYHVDKEKRTCEDCGQLFARVDQLNEHIRLHKMNLKCTICDHCFTRPARLRKHLREQHKDIPDYCPCISSEPNTVFSSCPIHFPGEPVHDCDVCGKQIRGPLSNLERHKKSHQQKEYECKTCGKIFDKYNPFYDHERTHLDKPYECSYEGCNMGFTQKYKLSVHVAAVHNKSRFECDICNKRFGTAYYLKLHKRGHTGEEWYKCDHPGCDKQYRMKASLKMHRITHGTEKPYTCMYCKRGFWQKVNMIQHQRVHTNERPFKCGMCDRSFKFKNQLTSHQRFHSGEDVESLRCGTCYKIFSSKSSLTAHERIHTDGRPYQCGMCYKSFQRKDHLVRHVQACQGVTDNQLVLSADVSQNGEIVLSTEGNQQTELILTDASHNEGDTTNMVSIIQPDPINESIQVELVNETDINAEAVANITDNDELTDENIQMEETVEIDPSIEVGGVSAENEDGQVLYVDPNSQGVLVKGVDGSENLFYVVLNQPE